MAEKHREISIELLIMRYGERQRINDKDIRDLRETQRYKESESDKENMERNRK